MNALTKQKKQALAGPPDHMPSATNTFFLSLTDTSALSGPCPNPFLAVRFLYSSRP